MGDLLDKIRWLNSHIEWVEFRFDVPANYTCSGSGCWATVTYNFNSGNPTDRTTWGARINGTPIHLLNETTPSS